MAMIIKLSVIDKKKCVKKIVIKTVCMTIILIGMQGIDNIWSQIMANYLALQQMNNSVDSSAWIQAYTYFCNYKFLIVIAFAALLYKKEIKKMIHFLREKRKTNEKEI